MSFHESEKNNQYDEKSDFYRRFEAEKHVRQLAEKYPNSYNIAIFACYRQLEKTNDKGYEAHSNATALPIREVK